MKNWKKGILGVALSFMVLFTAVGYAALTDTLSIVGDLFASEPKELYITNIEGLDAAITGLISMSGSGGTYTVTVKNNHPTATYVYTGATVTNGALTKIAYIGTGEDDPYSVPLGVEFPFSDTKSDDGVYISGIPIKKGETLTFVVELNASSDTEDVKVDFSFSEQVKYSIYYINNGEALDIRCVLDNSKPVSTENDAAKQAAIAQMQDGATTVEFAGWMNSGSSVKDTIDAEYLKNLNDPTKVELFPKFNAPFTAMFVNQDGSLLAWCFFNDIPDSKYYYDKDDENTYTLRDAMKDADDAAKAILPTLEYEFEIDYWIVRGTGIDPNDSDEDGSTDKVKYDRDNFAGYTTDVTIYPHYKYLGADLNPADDGNDGDVDHYEVNGYPENSNGTTLVVIPSHVNGVPVTIINPNAFSSYDDLHAVVIPETITEINGQAFTANNGTGRDTVTLYYEGDPATWKQYMDNFYAVSSDSTSFNQKYCDYNDENPNNKGTILTINWDYYMGDGSRIFFLDQETGKVDQSAGYWELQCDTGNRNFRWVYHNHAYTIAGMNACTHGAESHYEFSTSWNEILSGGSVKEENMTDYDGTCSCKLGTHDRPDAIYWTTATTASEEEATTP